MKSLNFCLESGEQTPYTICSLDRRRWSWSMGTLSSASEVARTTKEGENFWWSLQQEGVCGLPLVIK